MGIEQKAQMLQKTSVRIMGSAASELANGASWKLDVFWASRLQLWDIDAGILPVKEAGGICQNEKGKEFNFLEDETLVASSATISSLFLQNL